MKKIDKFIALIVAIFTIIGILPETFAEDTYAEGYYREDGTYVTSNSVSRSNRYKKNTGGALTNALSRSNVVDVAKEGAKIRNQSAAMRQQRIMHEQSLALEREKMQNEQALQQEQMNLEREKFDYSKSKDKQSQQSENDDDANRKGVRKRVIKEYGDGGKIRSEETTHY